MRDNFQDFDGALLLTFGGVAVSNDLEASVRS